MNPPAPANPPVDPRIYLAAERTLLAWIRTGVALMGFGLVVAKLRLFLDELQVTRGLPTPASTGLSLGSGILLLGLGVFLILAATHRHYRYVGALMKFGPDVPVPRRFPAVIALVLALAGVLLAIGIAVTARGLSDAAQWPAAVQPANR